MRFGIPKRAQEAGRREQEIERIVVDHEAGLLRYATRILRNPAAAEDVVQNAFVKMAKAWRNGSRPTNRLRAWLYQVTHNEAVDHIRRECRTRLLHERHAAASALTDAAHEARESARRDERHAAVMAWVERLKPVEKQVLLLRMEEGLSYREIAAVTGRTVGNVGCILHGAVRTVACRLQRAEAADGMAGAGPEKGV